jgi:hypothetical protein
MNAGGLVRAGGTRFRVELALPLAVFVGLALVYFPLTADDAYIVARYADHVVRGEGLVYNAGERVNALTSPTHALVVTLLRLATAQPIYWYASLAPLAVAAALAVVARRTIAERSEQALFLALTLVSPFLAFWSVGGLETPILVVLCTTLAAWCAGPRPFAPAAFADAVLALCVTVALTRPDFALLGAPVAAVAAVDLARRRALPRAGALALALALAWLAFAWRYYGDPLPTSAYVKSPLAQDARSLLLGAGYFASLAVLSLLWLPAFARKRGDRRLPVDAYRRALWVGVMITAAYAVLAGTKHMMYAYRLYVPLLPVVALLFATRPGARRVPAAIALAVCAWQLGLGYVLYAYSENPNLSLLVRAQRADDELYEFSTIGARFTGTFLAAVRDSADAVRADWAQRPESRERPARLAVFTGGILPYELADAYVYESLVSFRLRCRVATDASADYRQVIRAAFQADAPPVIDGYDPARWTRVWQRILHAEGIDSLDVSIEMWHQATPAPNRLSNRVDRPC